MRALLISANTEQLQMPVLPMGLACVAAAAEHAGHEVKLLNLMTKDDFQELKLENSFLGFQPEIVGVSVRNIDDQNMNSPKFLLEAVKNVVTACRRYTSAPIVLGGAGYSMYPQSALAYLGADMGIKGEGESAFVMLLDRLSRKEDLGGVPNLVLAGSGLENKTEVLKKLDDSCCPIPSASSRFPPNLKIRKSGSPFRPAGAALWNAVTVRPLL